LILIDLNCFKVDIDGFENMNLIE